MDACRRFPGVSFTRPSLGMKLIRPKGRLIHAKFAMFSLLSKRTPAASRLFSSQSSLRPTAARNPA